MLEATRTTRMISMAALITAATAGSARADDSAQVQAALSARSASAIDPLLGDSVRVGPVLFLDATCRKRFATAVTVTGDDRKQVATCFAALKVDPHRDLPFTFSDHSSGAIFTVTMAQHKLVAIGPVDPSGKDAALPTLEAFGPAASYSFTPSRDLRAAIDKLPTKSTHATIKSCTDGTSRIVHSSGIAAYDKEVGAFLIHMKIPADAFNFEQQAIAPACIVWPFGWSAHRDLVQPVKIEKVPPGENGETEGGVEGDLPPPPPPPPPPPAPPQIVAPAVLEALRIAGDAKIEPDDATKKQIAADLRNKIVGTFKLCVGTDGAVTSVVLLKSTRYDAYDAKLASAMRAWKYKPFLVAGRATPVCTAVTFIYTQ